MAGTMIGAYGPWAASLCDGQLPRLSFRRPEFIDPDVWRQQARTAALEHMVVPPATAARDVQLVERLEYDGLSVERLQWDLGYGPPTEAVVLKPAGARGPLPGVIGLHCHGGNKYLGLRKIAAWGQRPPVVLAHHQQYYGGLAWTNELARRGYVVLAHDVFSFASRRIRPEDCCEAIRGDCPRPRDDDPESIRAFNQWAGAHENLIAKSLFAAGTTWAGVFFSEDRAALDVLAGRDDVDPARLGCVGLSGGGLRTAFLAGLEERVRCSVSIGFMTTWRDFLLNKCHTHTWMAFTPRIANDLDFPDLLSCRMPQPTMVQHSTGDDLFTLAETKIAEGVLGEVFAKAGAAENLRFNYYDGPHQFHAPMQQDAFDWLDRWLKG